MMAFAMLVTMKPVLSTESSERSKPTKPWKKPIRMKNSRAKKMRLSFIMILTTISIDPKNLKVSKKSMRRCYHESAWSS